MSARRWSYIALATLLFAIAVNVGCNRARSDVQIANDVQQKILGDGNVPSKQFTVSANNGVVTLSGNVGSELERTAAANDAALVEGVRTVVNNLTVTEAQASVPAPVETAQPPAPPVAARKPSPRHVATSPRRSSTYQQPEMTPVPPAAPAVAAAPAPVAQTPPPPPPPKPVTIPDGTTLSIRMIDPIDSDRNQIGDRFHATLDTPISIGDQVILPQGADIEGRVAQLRSSGHFTGQSEIALELTSVSVNGRRYNVQTDQYSRQGSSRGKNTAAKVGGGAAVGAILGGIIGGGKGAAIGATVGAGAGTGVQAATKGQQIHITPEQILTFRLESPLTVTPSANNSRRARAPMTTSENVHDYSNDQSPPQPDDTNPPVLKRRDE